MKTNFLFSSVGDNTQFDNMWINKNMDYDIYIIYYGENTNIFNKYKSKVHFCIKRSGGKYQNFKYFYDNFRHIIDEYERFFILDDDIIFNVNDINNMFRISKQYRLEICSPSFILADGKGKWGWNVMMHKENVMLTYTNFIENGVALFNKNALDKFMIYYNNDLIGWGIDFLYMWANNHKKKKAYAVVHFVKCINPTEQHKEIDKRELMLINNSNNEKEIWSIYSKKINCPEWYEVKENKTITHIPKYYKRQLL